MNNIERLNNPKFRFREDEIARIHYAWSEGQSVLLTGIRRTGKSWVLEAALYRYAQDGHAVECLDVQDQNSLPRFYQDLLQALISAAPQNLKQQLSKKLETFARIPNKLSNWVRGQINTIKIPEVLEVELTPPDEELLRYWQPLAEQIGAVLAQHDPNKLPVIGIDELPFMLENLLSAGVKNQELVIMLASLRKLRDAGLRMGIAGSVSFENILTLQNIPHTVLGGLSRQLIPAFTRNEAHEFLEEKLSGRPAVEELDVILNLLPDYVPEFLVTTANDLYPCRDSMACKDALVQLVLPAIRRSFLQQFDERLEKNYSDEEKKTAQHILDNIARVGVGGALIDGSQLPVDYRTVLLKLEYDNFLIEGEEFKWRFSLNLIRRWWRANRGIA